MVKIALVGIAAVLVAMLFKNGKMEFGFLISITTCLIILFFGLGKLEVFISVINRIDNYLSINKEYISILMKVIGITYISEFSSALCKDAGYGAIGEQIEFAGKLTIMGISMPVLLALLDTIEQFFQI